MGAMAVALLLAAAGWAQQAAQPVWQGVLRNEGGAPVSGARVRLSGGGKHAEAVSGADGRFRIGSLPEGHYRLTVSVGLSAVCLDNC